MYGLSHDCLICGLPCGTEPRYGLFGVGYHKHRGVKGYEHAECRRRKAEVASRRRKATMATKWEKAGQMVFGPTDRRT